MITKFENRGVSYTFIHRPSPQERLDAATKAEVWEAARKKGRMTRRQRRRDARETNQHVGAEE